MFSYIFRYESGQNQEVKKTWLIEKYKKDKRDRKEFDRLIEEIEEEL